MNTVPVNYLYNSGDMLNRVDYLLEAVGYKVREMDEHNLENEKITQYHFLMGIYTDLKILDEQLKLYINKVEE
mgnify:CR=1 FL=1